MITSPAEITRLLRERIDSFSEQMETVSSGTVIQVGDGIARVHGLKSCMYMELLEFEDSVYGMAMSLEADNVGVVILGEEDRVREGSTVRCTGRIMEVPVGNGVIGRVLDPLGKPLDGKSNVSSSQTRRLEEAAPGVIQREGVQEPLQTGWKAIDAMIPIGRGQRELIIGDRGTGKTALAIDTILNQKDTGILCVYVAIGQKQSTVARVHQILKDKGAMDYTVIISAGASDPAALQYIAPYAGCAIGEWVRDNGGHALIVYDDLTKHAYAYRQLSLLLRRPPGREAYPGDVFNLHSRLLERAAKLSKELGGGSLTALPIIETQAGDVSAYIPTNVISITDGQIYLESSLFYAGIRPAVNVGISVSRVGGKAQQKAMRQVAGRLRIDLAQFRELEAFAQFGTDLDKSAMTQIARGQRMIELLKQGEHQPMPFENQIVVLFAAANGYLDDLPVDQVRVFEKKLLDHIIHLHPQILAEIRASRHLSDDFKQTLSTCISNFKSERL